MTSLPTASFAAGLPRRIRARSACSAAGISKGPTALTSSSGARRAIPLSSSDLMAASTTKSVAEVRSSSSPSARGSASRRTTSAVIGCCSAGSEASGASISRSLAAGSLPRSTAASSACRSPSSSASSVLRAIFGTPLKAPGTNAKLPSVTPSSRKSAFSPSTAPKRALTGRPSESWISPCSSPLSSDRVPLRRLVLRIWSRSGMPICLRLPSISRSFFSSRDASSRRNTCAMRPSTSSRLKGLRRKPSRAMRSLSASLAVPVTMTGMSSVRGLVRRICVKVRASTRPHPLSKSTISGWRSTATSSAREPSEATEVW